MGGSEVHALVAASGPIWLRATVCDANRNCTQSVKGPLSPLVPAPPAKRPRLKLHIVGRQHEKLRVRLTLGAGGSGKVTVQIESWSGTRWRAFDRVRLAFGKTVTRTEHVAKAGRYKLRARIAATPTTLKATSRPVTLRVR